MMQPTEQDVDHPIATCGECDYPDYAEMLWDGLCAYCAHIAEMEWRENMAAIDRELNARNSIRYNN